MSTLILPSSYPAMLDMLDRQHGGSAGKGDGHGASASGVNETPITIMLKKTTKATERVFDLADVPSLEKRQGCVFLASFVCAVVR